MSTNCYVLDPLAVNPIDRSVTKLLYVSVARYSAEWHSILHTRTTAHSLLDFRVEGIKVTVNSLRRISCRRITSRIS